MKSLLALLLAAPAAVVQGANLDGCFTWIEGNAYVPAPDGFSELGDEGDIRGALGVCRVRADHSELQVGKYSVRDGTCQYMDEDKKLQSSDWYQIGVLNDNCAYEWQDHSMYDDAPDGVVVAGFKETTSKIKHGPNKGQTETKTTQFGVCKYYDHSYAWTEIGKVYLGTESGHGMCSFPLKNRNPVGGQYQILIAKNAAIMEAEAAAAAEAEEATDADADVDADAN